MPEYKSGSGTPYWYEWEIGLIKCLDMMTDMNIRSVTLQSTDFQSLDDVVVNYSNGSSCNIQVKHTDVDGNFTYSTLAAGKNPMLRAWARDWKASKDKFHIAEIHIVTNKQWGIKGRDGRCSFSQFIGTVFPILKNDYYYTGKNAQERNAISWFKEQLSFLGTDAPEFVRLLSFEQEGNLQEVDDIIKQQITMLLGTTDKTACDLSRKALLAELSVWATSLRESQEITRENVYKVLCCDSKVPPKFDLFPELPVFPSRIGFAKQFIQLLKTTDKKVVFLEGFPGSGKTSFVSYLAQLKDTPVDFRFYTYLPVNKDYPSYSDDQGFFSGELLWRSILFQLKKKFEKLGVLSEIEFPLIYCYLTVAEMRETALRFLPKYAELTGHPCILFIDGLDHAARSYNSSTTLLFQLPRPDEIGESVKFVLVSQPINEHFPSWLSSNPQVEYISLPELSQEDVIMLLQDEPFCAPETDRISLSQSIIDVVGNNALNVLFAIQEAKTHFAGCTFDEIIQQLKQCKLNEQIGSYYEWIISSVGTDILSQKLKFIFAFSSSKITLEQVVLLCDKPTEEVSLTLSRMLPLVMEDQGLFYAFHNDVRLFFKRIVLSARNYPSLALAIRDRILAEPKLHRFAYDILFSSLCELTDSTYLISFFSPEYIIESVKYDVSLNNLLIQFETVSSILADNTDLNSLHRFSLVATALEQYLSCVHYYVKENEHFDNAIISGKMRTEKNVLERQTDLPTIVEDIYKLLINNQDGRAKKLFGKHLSSCKLREYLSYTVEADEHEGLGFYEQCGFVCRYYYPDVFKEHYKDDESYYKFVNGWLQASVSFIRPEEIETTFTFSGYYSHSLFSYIVGLCEKKNVSEDALNVLNRYLIGHSVHIAALVELCVKEIISDCCTDELLNEIQLRYSEIAADDQPDIFHFPSDKLPCLFKAFFCIYPRLTEIKPILENYKTLLYQNHVRKQTDRGFPPANQQFSRACKVFSAYYSGNCDNAEILDTIFSLAYIGKKFGAGSCHDCAAYPVRKFLFKVIYKTYEKECDPAKSSSLCVELMNLFINPHPYYDAELALLYLLANEKERYIEIVQHWAGPDGLMWKNEYDEVEYYYNSISWLLDQFGMTTLKSEIELRMKYRIVSYSGHKDYSLNDLLEWYKVLPLSTEKLLTWGAQLLSISDSAHEIGDNRMSGSVDKELFRIAVDLGPQYSEALFEVKNTPKDFCYWRDCLLNSYFEKLSSLCLRDSELFSLYQIVNAWINVRIEESKQRGYNKLNYLQRYNSEILSIITDTRAKAIIESNGYYTYTSTGHTELTPAKNPFDWLLVELAKEGYSKELQYKIQAFITVDSYGLLSFLLSAGDRIEPAFLPTFAHECVVKYILTENKYCMQETGLDQLFHKYYLYFTENDWQQLLLNTVSKASTDRESLLYSMSHDLEVLDLYYSASHHMNHIEDLFSDKLNLHWALITANGLLSRKEYHLSLDPSINCLQDFVAKHIGKL